MTDYVSGAAVCRRCIEDDVELSELVRYLDEYVSSLPENIRATPEEYKRRLEICAGCERRAGINCTLCGCYIQARAAKAALECPNDKGGPKWRAQRRDEADSN